MLDYGGLGITVEATRRGLNQITKKLSPQRLFELGQLSLLDTLAELKAILIPSIPVDTGLTAEHIFSEIHGTTLDDLEGIVASPDPHFKTLEYGRMPGAAMPPRAPIEAWMGRQGIDIKASFPIRRAISRRGLPAKHLMRKALEEGRRHFSDIWFKRYLSDWGEGETLLEDDE